MVSSDAHHFLARKKNQRSSLRWSDPVIRILFGFKRRNTMVPIWLTRSPA
jgi:hypothetical protein